MKLSPWNILSSQLTPTPPVPTQDLSGQTVIVIGANAGIGYETARHLGSMNPGKLILACRDKGRGEDAAERLRRETGSSNNIEMWLLDLGSFESVNAFAERIEFEDLPRIDLLIENASVLPTEALDGTQDGWEAGFQVNNLSTSLLSLLLIPRMVKTAREFNTKPRIVVVSSEVHYFAKLRDKVLTSDKPLHAFGKLENCEEGDVVNRYYDTKLLNVFFVRALAEHLHDQPLIADTVNPGYCISNLRKGLSGFRAAVDWVMEKLVARTSEEGARQVVWAAIGGKENEDALRGTYISQMGVQEPSDFVVSPQGKAFQEKIWVDMIDELCMVNPKLRTVVDQFLSKAGPDLSEGVQEPEPTNCKKTLTTSSVLEAAMKEGDESSTSLTGGLNRGEPEVHPKFSYADVVSQGDHPTRETMPHKEADATKPAKGVHNGTTTADDAQVSIALLN